jgi:hypothetical protein
VLRRIREERYLWVTVTGARRLAHGPKEPPERRLQAGLPGPQGMLVCAAKRPIDNRPDPEGTPTNLPHKYKYRQGGELYRIGGEVLA